MFSQYQPSRQVGRNFLVPALGAPPGTAIDPGLADLLSNLTTQIGLSSAGVFTPWAGRVSDLQWQEIKSPDTNIAMFGIDDRQVNLAQQLMFGQPIPFLTIRTLQVAPTAKIEQALGGSAYELFEVQATYSQEDNDPIPQIWYLYWVRRLPLEEEGKKSMEQVAQELNGSLYFSQQVPAESSTLRSAPTVSFEQARGGSTPVEPPKTTAPTNPAPKPPKTTPVVPDEPLFPVQPRPQSGLSAWIGPVALGVAVAAGTVAFVKAVRK